MIYQSYFDPNNYTYFLVSEIISNHHDSYVLPLSKKENIEFARKIIDDPTSVSSTIIVAKIDYWSGEGEYISKDIILPSKRIWSWHVTEFIAFAGDTIEILDGWPTFVEENLDSWMNNTSSMIEFWGYTVTREVFFI